jgi:glycerol-3-phosphate acyltransferase PlsY
MLVDALKGALAAAIGAWVSGPLGFWCALAAVVGHVFPVWHKLKGGRGVATAIGAVLFLEPWWGLILAVGWAATVALTKTASIASLGAMALYVPGYALFGRRGWPLVAAGLTAALVIVRHSANIRRLIKGRERTVETQ